MLQFLALIAHCKNELLRTSLESLLVSQVCSRKFLDVQLAKSPYSAHLNFNYLVTCYSLSAKHFKSKLGGGQSN